VAQNSYPEVPDADVALETARGEEFGDGGVEGDAPGRPLVAAEDVLAAPCCQPTHPHCVVSVRRRHVLPAMES
jgi:hypothetical protein